MKKLLLSLMTVSVAASGTLTVVACSQSKTYKEIYVITDSGSISDKAFNESGYNASNYFIENIIGEEGYKTAYIEPKQTTATALTEAYTNATNYGAKTLVLPGFHHAVEGANKGAEIVGEKGGSTIILDNTSSGVENQVGIVFRGDMSGFYAGFASIIESFNLNNYSESNGVATVKMGTYGGMDTPGSVTNFMIGFLAAAEVFNTLVAKENQAITSLITNDSLKNIELKASSVLDLSTPQNYFLGGFDTGEAPTNKASNLTKQFVNSGANIIMPVAGAHTSTTLGVLKELRADKTLVVGVDTDQVQAYTNYSDKFLTSATKDIVNSAVVALGHVKAYVNDATIQTKVIDYAVANNLVLTYDDKLAPGGKGGTKIDFTADKALSWEGYDLWSDGGIAYGGKNKVTQTLNDAMLKVLTPDIVRASSIALFKQIDTAGSNTVLTQANIDAYANAITEAIAN